MFFLLSCYIQSFLVYTFLRSDSLTAVLSDVPVFLQRFPSIAAANGINKLCDVSLSITIWADVCNQWWPRMRYTTFINRAVVWLPAGLTRLIYFLQTNFAHIKFKVNFTTRVPQSHTKFLNSKCILFFSSFHCDYFIRQHYCYCYGYKLECTLYSVHQPLERDNKKSFLSSSILPQEQIYFHCRSLPCTVHFTVENDCGEYFFPFFIIWFRVSLSSATRRTSKRMASVTQTSPSAVDTSVRLTRTDATQRREPRNN